MRIEYKDETFWHGRKVLLPSGESAYVLRARADGEIIRVTCMYTHPEKGTVELPRNLLKVADEKEARHG